MTTYNNNDNKNSQNEKSTAPKGDQRQDGKVEEKKSEGSRQGQDNSRQESAPKKDAAPQGSEAKKV